MAFKTGDAQMLDDRAVKTASKNNKETTTHYTADANVKGRQNKAKMSTNKKQIKPKAILDREAKNG